jgi:tetratricopeptide (TPR) repeat protein
MDDERHPRRDARAPGEGPHGQRAPLRAVQGQGVQAGDGNAQFNDFGPAQSVTAGGDVQAPSVTAGGNAEVAGRDIIKNYLAPERSAPERIVTGSIPQAPPAFQLRADLLAQLRAAGPGMSVVYAITGQRGVGKTQIAAAYARECVNAGWRLVAWVNAETVPEALAGLALIAAELGIATESKSVEAIGHQVRSRLEADGGRCLVVFDNVTDLAALRQYVPAAGQCQVVLTSTSENAATLGTPVAVDVFTEDESLAFLATRTRRSDPDGARELAGELGHLPLALAQAAAVITAQRLTYQVYSQRLREFPLGEYLTAEEGGSYPRGLAEAILLSVKTVTTADTTGLCAELLGMIALLSPAGVSRLLLHAMGKSSASVDSALGKLATASLLTLGEDSTVTAHRLVMRVLRESRASDGTLAAIGDRACDLLTAVTGSLDEPWRDRPAARDFVQQVTALHEHLSPHLRDEDTALAERLLILRGWALSYLNELGDSVAQAIELGGPLVADQVRLLGESHPGTLTARHELAFVYRVAGQVSEAIRLYEAVLADSVRVQGESHPHTLVTRHNLAVAYREAGRVGEATALLEAVLADRVRVLGESHPGTLTARHELAIAYRVAGRVGEAIALYEGVLADRVRVQGESHPHTLTARHNLAVAFRVAGRVGEAIGLFEDVLADFVRVLGESHPDTLTARHELAVAFRVADRVDEAIPLFEAVLAGREAVLGPDHPDTVNAREHLAQARAELQRSDQLGGRFDGKS